MKRDDFFKLLTSGQWSNASCMGYVIKACKSLTLEMVAILCYNNTTII